MQRKRTIKGVEGLHIFRPTKSSNRKQIQLIKKKHKQNQGSCMAWLINKLCVCLSIRQTKVGNHFKHIHRSMHHSLKSCYWLFSIDDMNAVYRLKLLHIFFKCLCDWIFCSLNCFCGYHVSMLKRIFYCQTFKFGKPSSIKKMCYSISVQQQICRWVCETSL